MLVSRDCAGFCRFCFRRELIIDGTLDLPLEPEEGIRFIRSNPRIRDVLITGGDPLILPDHKIEQLIRKLREIPHVQMIRFGTRVPVLLPQRITQTLMKILDGYHSKPIWINIHCNHPGELTEDTARAVFKLLSCGIGINSQTVLLKGINDDPDTFIALQRKLLSMRIRPYYLFHCCAAPGINHFITSVGKGNELIDEAIKRGLTGLALPRYVASTNKGKVFLEKEDRPLKQADEAEDEYSASAFFQ